MWTKAELIELITQQHLLLQEWEENAVTAAKTELGKLGAMPVMRLQGTGTSLLERTRRQLEATRIKLR